MRAPHDEDVATALLATLPIKPKRKGYTGAEKDAILSVLNAEGGNKAATMRVVHKKSGYEKVTRTHLIRWLRAGTSAKKRMGRRVNEPFERAVLGHLLFTVLEKVDDVESARIVANIAHSYEIIKRAATEAPWASDAKIQKLKFSNKWVCGFLRRATLRRRRNTSSDKKLPPVSVVAARMKESLRQGRARRVRGHLLQLHEPLSRLDARDPRARGLAVGGAVQGGQRRRRA
jgi:hypothetical protein